MGPWKRDSGRKTFCEKESRCLHDNWWEWKNYSHTKGAKDEEELIHFANPLCVQDSETCGSYSGCSRKRRGEKEIWKIWDPGYTVTKEKKEVLEWQQQTKIGPSRKQQEDRRLWAEVSRKKKLVDYLIFQHLKD